MVIEPSLRSAVILSSVLHISLLVGGNWLDHYWQAREWGHDKQDLEITYSHSLKMPESLKSSVAPSSEEKTSFKEEFVTKELVTGLDSRVVSQDENVQEKIPLEEKDLPPEQELTEGLHLSHEEKPLYLAYYQGIREKIRRSAHIHYSQGAQKGEVVMSFVLFSNGRLKEITAKGHDPIRDRALQEVAIRSVIDASPFPPFPEGLKRSFVPFRVMITFAGKKAYRGGE